MKRAFMNLAVVTGLASTGCGTAVAPTVVAPSFFLSTVNGKPLPAPYGGDEFSLVSGYLAFDTSGRPRGEWVNGLVAYTLDIRRPDQTIDHSKIDLNYSITFLSNGAEIRINLCPPLALCLINTELVGPFVDWTSTLVLTHYLGGQPGPVYRYFPSLPD